ncbi:cyclic nucleotide-binding domain-containing protein [Desulfonema magnum]|uniref:Cyclic nucleotide-binding domain-containing protein n=1 Tax=Desulfonema magnum TaxID=45655 RepID=A0A975BRU3_9BACT|nr:cyclic nucleotide-binding domain-containing protein [Desulfonema magnum]QTA90471.1 Cyclic nucleotide-binding domain-containing protein [Desulfonema magnum]
MFRSKYFKNNILNIQRLITNPPLRKFEIKNLRQSLRLSRIKAYEDGELIIEKNDRDPCIYFLLSGKVRVRKEGAKSEIIDRQGEIFGEMEILDGLVTTASVYAEGKVVCLAVNPPSFANRLTSDEITDVLLLLYRIFMEFIAIRLRLINDELVKTKKEAERLRGGA